MVQAFVVCPQCGKRFKISISKKTGICPQCYVSLIFEVVNPPAKKTGRGCHEEYIAREELQEVVDETIIGKSQEPHHPRVQDIAIISTFGPPRQLVTIEKSVDRLLRSRG
jgi:hypothetical protein